MSDILDQYLKEQSIQSGPDPTQLSNTASDILYGTPEVTPRRPVDLGAYIAQNKTAALKGLEDQHKALIEKWEQGKIDLPDEQVDNLYNWAANTYPSAWQQFNKGRKSFEESMRYDNIGNTLWNAGKGIAGLIGTGVKAVGEQVAEPSAQQIPEEPAQGPFGVINNLSQGKLTPAQATAVAGVSAGFSELAPQVVDASSAVASMAGADRANALKYAGTFRRDNAMSNQSVEQSLGAQPELYPASYETGQFAGASVPYAIAGEAAGPLLQGWAQGSRAAADALVEAAPGTAGRMAKVAAFGGDTAAGGVANVVGGLTHKVPFGGLVSGPVKALTKTIMGTPSDLLNTVAEQLMSTPRDITIAEGASRGMTQEVGRFAEQLTQLKANPDIVKDVSAATMKDANGNLLFTTQELDNLSKLTNPSLRARAIQDAMVDAARKKRLWDGFIGVNKLASDSAKLGISSFLNAVPIGMGGAAIAGTSAEPWNVEEAAKGGTESGLGFGLASGPLMDRYGLHANNAVDLSNLGRKNVVDTSHPLFQEDQEARQGLSKSPEGREKLKLLRQVQGISTPLGQKYVVLDPDTFLKLSPPGAERAPRAVINGDVTYVNSAAPMDTLFHELVHPLEESIGRKALDTAFATTAGDPDKVARVKNFVAKYDTAARASDPNYPGLTPENASSEIAAEIGRDVMHGLSPAKLYGGQDSFSMMGDGIRNLFNKIPGLGNPDPRVVAGIFDTPMIPEVRHAVTGMLYDLGEAAKRGEKLPGQREPSEYPYKEADVERNVQDYKDQGMTEDEAIRRVAADQQQQSQYVSPETGFTHTGPAFKTGPPAGQGIFHQLMPEAAPDTEEFKRWSGGAPVILNSGPKTVRPEDMGLDIVGNDTEGYTVVHQDGSLAFGGTWPKLSLKQAADAKARLAVNMAERAQHNSQAHNFQTGQPVVVGAYHGTPSDTFHVFDETKLGAYTGAPSAKQGFFFSGLPDTAESYRPDTIYPYQWYQDLSDQQRVEFHGIVHDKMMDYYHGPNGIWRMEPHWGTDPNVERGPAVERWAIVTQGGERIESNLDQAAAEKKISEHNAVLPNLSSEEQFVKDVPDAARYAFGKVTNGGEMDTTPVARPGHMHEVYVKMQNPYVYDFKGNSYRDETYNDLLKSAKQAGHDGAIFTNTYDGGGKPDNIFVTFDNKNIKSTANMGSFDPSNPDIRYMPQPDNPDAVAGAAIKLPDGKILTGSWHGTIDTQVPPEFKGKGIDGFVTGNGRFLTRDEAWVVGKRFGQIPKYARPLNKEELKSGTQTRPQLISEDIRPPAYMPEVNVGLHVNGVEKLTSKDVADALEAVPGVKITKLSERRDKWLSEPTVVATLSRALTADEGHAVSEALGQDVIAQHQMGGQGNLFGPRPEGYGADPNIPNSGFNPEYFATHSGEKLSDVMQRLPQRTGASGIWDRMSVDPTFKPGEFEKAAEATGANPKERFYRQTPAAQKAIQDYFKGRGEAQYMPSPAGELNWARRQYDMTPDQLEQFLIFARSVAGHQSSQRAPMIERMLTDLLTTHGGTSPIAALKELNKDPSGIENLLKKHGFGPYGQNTQFLKHIAENPLPDLASTTPEELRKIPHIGKATADFFKLHTDPNYKHLGKLDTHVLGWIRDFLDKSAPESSPPAGPLYDKYHGIFSGAADEMGVDPQALDMQIWKSRRRGPQFMPSTHPEAIRSAAVRNDENGKIYTGPLHWQAEQKMLDESSPEKYTHGYVTKQGKFLNRDQASEHAKRIGQITTEEYRDAVSGRTGIDPEELPDRMSLDAGAFRDSRRFMPDVPSDTRLKDALSEDKVAKIGAHRDLPKGTPVSLRIDIPAYNKTGDYAVTVHDRNIGKVHGYDGIATVDNPTFYVQEKGAQKVKEGMAKYPMAAVNGDFNPSRAIPKDIGDYTQVGFNPVKHSYFYDKNTGQPVISGDRAISAGNTVYVKNPVYGNPSGFLYMPDNPMAIDRAALRHKDTGEIITGGQNDTHFMIPATSGKADDYLGPNGHKLYDEGFVDHNRNWYNREQAHNQMKSMGQLPPQYQGEYANEANVTDLRKSRAIEQLAEKLPPEPGKPLAYMPSTPEDAAAAIEEGKQKFPEAFPRDYEKDKDGNYKLKFDKQAKKKQYVPVERPFDLTQSGLYAQSKDQSDFENKMVDKIVQEHNNVWSKDPETMQAKGWYDIYNTMREKGMSHEQATRFLDTAAATSARARAGSQFVDSLEAHNRMEAGDFDEIIKKYKEAYDKQKAGDLTFNKDYTSAQKKTYKEGDPVDSASAFRDYVEANGLVLRKSSGKRFGMHSYKVLQVMAGHYVPEGLKYIDFFNALTGRSTNPVIDIWSYRNIDRLANEGYKPVWRRLPENEPGVNDPDYLTSRRIMLEAAKKLGYDNPTDLQAIQWFGEKKQWFKNKWARDLDLGDYRPLLQRFEPVPGAKGTQFRLADVQPPQ